MQAETEHKVTSIRSSLTLLRQHIGWDQALARLEELNAEAEDQSLWDDQERAQRSCVRKTALTG